MSPAGWVYLLALAPAFAEVDLTRLLRGVEHRYNRPKTVQLIFEQSHSGPGRMTKIERGDLYLQRPGKMLWNYAQPSGKFFLSDGKHTYFYTPNTNQVSRAKVKESGDLRAPLAFLMGQLSFDRFFKEFRTRPEGANLYIMAAPKSAKAPYTLVEFLVSPENYQILTLLVTGQDQSIMKYRFTGETLNPRIEPRLFTFKPPSGAQLVEEADQ